MTAMSTPVAISLDEATLQRARIAASNRGVTVEDFLADLKSGPSSTIGEVEETRQK
jgi:hypothetical protein